MRWLFVPQAIGHEHAHTQVSNHTLSDEHASPTAGTNIMLPGTMGHADINGSPYPCTLTPNTTRLPESFPPTQHMPTATCVAVCFVQVFRPGSPGMMRPPSSMSLYGYDDMGVMAQAQALAQAQAQGLPAMEVQSRTTELHLKVESLEQDLRWAWGLWVGIGLWTCECWRCLVHNKRDWGERGQMYCGHGVCSLSPTPCRLCAASRSSRPGTTQMWGSGCTVVAMCLQGIMIITHKA